LDVECGGCGSDHVVSSPSPAGVQVRLQVAAPTPTRQGTKNDSHRHRLRYSGPWMSQAAHTDIDATYAGGSCERRVQGSMLHLATKRGDTRRDY
jgi:hypothetical protein